MKLMTFIFCLVFAFPAAAQNVDAINKAVKHCVEFVQKSSGTDMEKYSFSKFDAYYNPATGLVENNVVYVDDHI